MNPIVAPASKPEAAFVPWSADYPHIVAALRRDAAPLPPWLHLEHVGSTAIPGCGGKGVIDLLALYESGHREAAVAFLSALGFGPQGPEFRRPWPATRPMLLGTYGWKTTQALLYVHVVGHDSDEVRRFRTFRDRLVADPDLTAEYSRFKQHLIASGLRDTDDYAGAKSPIMHRILGADHALRDPSQP